MTQTPSLRRPDRRQGATIPTPPPLLLKEQQRPTDIVTGKEQSLYYYDNQAETALSLERQRGIWGSRYA